MQAALLVEVLTEELPPKALARLGESFRAELVHSLEEAGYVAGGAASHLFATPRRLAVLIPDVLDRQPDRTIERRGPAVKAGFDAQGRPTPALLGFARSCDTDVARLKRRSGDKGEYFVFEAKQKGEPLKNKLADFVEAALRKLPAPKLMRWGDGDAQFVRPLHGLVMLHGGKVVPGNVLGLKSGRKTAGHRFLGAKSITVDEAGHYEALLREQGMVVASLRERIERITAQLDGKVQALGEGATWRLGRGDDLVSEVASLVEYPAVYDGAFGEAFLSVPKECLIVSMQQHQKYFPLEDAKGGLLPRFLFVSNIETLSPQQIVHGNERVLKARLSDAKFFFEQDQKTRLADRVRRLAQVVYHNRLGTQLERVERIERLAADIAARLARADLMAAQEQALAARAAHLCKADLLTEMVGEFPELQGVMGRYYALHDGEDARVAAAIEQHYFPKAAGGPLPESRIAACVALADKLDTLVGIFGIGLVPTGDKDPFGLRRQALGSLRILAETSLPLDLRELLACACAAFPPNLLADNVVPGVHAFMLERLRPYLREQGFRPDEIEAVLDPELGRIDQVVPRLRALREFRALPDAEALAAANKRIHNILRQAGDQAAAADEIDPQLLREAAEQALASRVAEVSQAAQPAIAAGDYTGALRQMAQLRNAVDAFFEGVMVMAEDERLRRNRVALLRRIRALFLQVADISRLQPLEKGA